jgi:16S rRNA C1402 N4-methylase RsmH
VEKGTANTSIRVHLHAVFVQTTLNGGGSSQNLLHCRCRAGDNSRIFDIERDPQLVDVAPMPREAPIAEINAQ